MNFVTFIHSMVMGQAVCLEMADSAPTWMVICLQIESQRLPVERSVSQHSKYLGVGKAPREGGREPWE